MFWLLTADNNVYVSPVSLLATHWSVHQATTKTKLGTMELMGIEPCTSQFGPTMIKIWYSMVCLTCALWQRASDCSIILWGCCTMQIEQLHPYWLMSFDSRGMENQHFMHWYCMRERLAWNSDTTIDFKIIDLLRVGPYPTEIRAVVDMKWHSQSPTTATKPEATQHIWHSLHMYILDEWDDSSLISMNYRWFSWILIVGYELSNDSDKIIHHKQPNTLGNPPTCLSLVSGVIFHWFSWSLTKPPELLVGEDRVLRLAVTKKLWELMRLHMGWWWLIMAIIMHMKSHQVSNLGPW